MAVEDMPFLRGAAAAQTHEGSGNDDEAPAPAPAGPPNFELVWEEYQRRLDAQREWDENGIDIHPDYGFVAKTRDPKSKKKVRDACNVPGVIAFHSGFKNEFYSIQIFSCFCAQ